MKHTVVEKKKKILSKLKSFSKKKFNDYDSTCFLKI